jgi:CubicO group peptidase (beta-lactamase class C family)
MPLEDFLAERVFGPLGMKDTGFGVPEAQRHRLAVQYQADGHPRVRGAKPRAGVS